EQRKERAREMKEGDMDEVRLEKHMNQVEKEQFEDYANRVINYMDENGRNTYPMKKVLNEELKKYDQLNQGYSSVGNGNNNSKPGQSQQQMNRNITDTKKNLGFGWEVPK
ncbi:unnamed protein product, partial [Didymodactylos carnosus]